MRLGKVGYFLDFIVYPAIVMMLLAGVLRSESPLSWEESLAACFAGIAGWTLLEYVIHRFVLHKVAYLAAMHDMHHADPGAFVGAPTWLSLGSICCGALLPLCWAIGYDLARSVTAGLMLGYLWYGGVHYMVHHRQPEPGTRLHRLKRRHVLHHHARKWCNFGVTNGFWDRVFGTDFYS